MLSWALSAAYDGQSVSDPRADVIRPLDVAFSLDDLTEDAWFARVADALMPLFDQGRGKWAWINRIHRSKPDVLDKILHIEASPREVAGVEGLHQEGTAEDYATAYPAGAVGLHTLGTFFGKERFFTYPLLRRWIHEAGIGDVGGLHIRVGARKLVVGTFLSAPAVFPTVARRFAEALGRRISVAYQLREDLEGGHARVAAVLTPDAQVVHAEGSGRQHAVRERLRTAVVGRERARSSLRLRAPDVAVDLFDGIVEGRYTVADRFDSDGRRYLVAYENPSEIAVLRALTQREREILRRVVDGEPLKRIAADLDLTQSAVSAYLAAARKKTGLRTRQEMVRWFSSTQESRRYTPTSHR